MIHMHDTPDRDVLLSRLIDAEASADDWAAFKLLAAEDQSVWSELTDAQRAHDELAFAVLGATSVADSVDAPIEARLSDGLTARLRAFSTYGGWAAAAVLVLAFAIGRPGLPNTGMSTAGLGPAMVTADSQPDEALEAYLELGKKAGTVIGEAPQFVVLESTPLAEGGGHEIVYIRQLVERRRVETLYRPGRDELGNSVRVPVSISEFGAGSF